MASDSKSVIDKLQSCSEESFESILSDLHQSAKSDSGFKHLLPSLPSIIQSLQKATKYSENSLNLVESFFISILSYLPANASNSKYLESLRELVELDRPLYQSYSQDIRSGSWNPTLPIDLAFRSNLSVGSQVDAVKIDPKFDCKCWAVATIEKIDDEGLLYIHFEGETQEYDRVIPINSHEVRRYKEMSEDSWRQSLKPPGLIDCMDNSGVWHNSIVVDKRKQVVEGVEVDEVKVGFRCYVPYAEKQDDKGTYRGWSSSFDEWVSVRSPRLAPFGLNGRAWAIPRENFNEEDIILDCNDLLEPCPPSFCLTRVKKSSSIILINAINKAAGEGLFDIVMKVLNAGASFETIHAFVVFVGKIYALLHKKFAMNFIIPFKDVVFKSLFDSPVLVYRDYSKEKLDQIFDHFENLLKRVLTIQQKNKAIDQFLLEFAIKNLETPYLEKRIYGIRLISEAANKANLAKLRGMKSTELAGWVKSKKIVEVIYGDESHDQIVQRSGEVLKLLANDDSLSNSDIDLIWASSLKNDDLRKVVYSILIESGSALRQDILTHLIEKVSELPPGKLLQEEINLVYELTKIPVRAGSANIKACTFFQSIILQSEDHPDTCKNFCLEAYCNMLKNWEKSKVKPQVIETCVENIRANKNSLFAIRMILKILVTFPVAYSVKDLPTRNSIAQKMINEQGVVSALIDNIAYLKAKENKDLNYTEQISERLNFLKVLITESYTLKISEKQLRVLWDLLYSATEQIESKIFIKWLKEATDSQVNGKKIFEDQEIDRFFVDKIGNLENDFSGYSLEEFSIFKNCFLSINLNTSKMSRLYSNLNQSTSEIAPEFDYMIKVAPIELHGMTALRKIILVCKSPEVKNQSSSLLYEIYNHATAFDQKTIRKELLSFLLTTLKSDTTEHKKRSLEILKRFSEECEKNGTSLKSPHCALLKGQETKLTIINMVSYSSFLSAEVPKKFEITVKSNTTVWQLRNLIGKKVKCLYDQFKITRSLLSIVEISDSENGRTLHSLRLKPNENLTLYKRISMRSKVNLLAPDGKLVPAAEKIFRKWFHRFADKGDKMSPEGAAEFTNSCTGENCKPTDKKMLDFVALYDRDRDGLLEIEDFLEFYRSSCLTKPHAVWNNLGYHNYRNDLLGYEDDADLMVDQESLPSNLLSENSENFRLIFEQLNNPEVEQQAWDLVCKLPTNPDVLELVSNIDGNTDWNLVLNSEFSYKLLYVLQVIQSFLQDPSQDEMLTDFPIKRKWKTLFIRTNGVKALLDKLTSCQSRLNTCQKICLESVVKIVSVFILSAFTRPDIIETVELVRKESLNLDQAEEETSEKKGKSLEPKQQNSGLALSTLSEDIFKEGLSDHLLASIDFQSLMNNLLSLMHSLTANEVLDPEDKSILDSALELSISCMLHKNELISCLYNFSLSFSDLLSQTLTKPNLESVRKSFAQAYLAICKKVVYQELSPVPYFLQTLLKSIQEPALFNDSSQLYDLITNLIEIDKSNPTQDYLELAKSFLKQIFDIPYKECKSNAHSDPVLVGVLKVANKIFMSFLDYRKEVVDADLIDKIFTEVLFPRAIESYNQEYNSETLKHEDQMKPPKAKYKDSRRAAYNLLMTLTVCEEHWSRQVIDHLLSIKSRLADYDVWNYFPSSQQRSLHGYAGLFNYSSICYMNSVLQQFFMIPQFRYSILAAEDHLEPDLAEVPEWFIKKTGCPSLMDNNLLHQLQHMYGFLELTDKQAYKPAGFCFAYKDYSGEPANTSIQQDSQEFINFFLERLDKSLEVTSLKNLVSNTFKGKISNQIICNECRNITERVEDFCNISLDVKHSKTIHESFAKFVSGDTISGYNCESCKKQVEISKRSLLHTLPNYMIVHLQRMVFNYDTMENEKINSRLEFPMDLNVFQYSTEGFERNEGSDCSVADDYHYDLQGIIVHLGTAQAGHYYSYIKDKNKWLEFNDTSIKSFNSQLIEAQCFGGTSENDNFVKLERESAPNAYMLIYEKRLAKKPVEVVLGGEIEIREFDVVKKHVPDWIFREVLKENNEFLFEKNVFSFDFFEFLLSSLRNAKYLFDVGRVTIDYTFDVVAHAYHYKSISMLVDVICECFTIYPETLNYFFTHFLSQNGEKVIKYLLRSNENIIRQSSADLLFTALKLSSQSDFSESSPVKQLLHLLLSFIPQELSKYSAKYEQYWYLFSKLSQIESFGNYLLEQGAITAFIDFYLGSDSPLAKSSDPQSNKSSWNTNFRYLVISIYHLHVFIQSSEYQFSENDKKCITHPEFFIRSIKKNYDEQAINYLVQFWAKSDLNFSEKLAESFLVALNDLEFEEQEYFYKTIMAFLNIEDELADLRIQWMFGVPVPVYSNKTFSIEFCAAAVSCIEEDVFTYPSFVNFAGFDTRQSVSSLVWSQRKRWDGVCIISINWVLEICQANAKVFNYMQSLPSPNYQHSNYYSWMVHHVKTYKTLNNSKRDLTQVTCLTRLDQLGPAISTLNYVINDSVSSTEAIKYEENFLAIKQINYKCLVANSSPNGKTNDALPHLKLLTDKDTSNSTIGKYEEAECVVVIALQNQSRETKQIWFEFQSPMLNSYYPITGFSVKVPAESDKSIFTLIKINPCLPWEEIVFSVRQEKTVETVKKVMVDNYNDNLDIFELDDLSLSTVDTFMPAPSGQISCPLCTFFNDSTYTSCTMCGSTLPKR